MVRVIKDADEEEEDKARILLANTNNGGKMAAVLFPKLEVLRLEYLPKLESFCEFKCDVVLPSLWSATIHKCPHMKNLSLDAPNLKEFSTDLNNDLRENVIFNGLKILSIVYLDDVEYPLYHHKFFISVVDGLEELSLHGHESMSCLFPSSIARKLVNLRSLRISNCGEMEKVIEEEEEDDEVVSGGRATLLFPKLEGLRLENLPKLVSFCESRKCVVELPSLREVAIFHCPIMKSFSLGHLTAPNLEFILIDQQHFGGEKDLNDMLAAAAVLGKEQSRKQRRRRKTKR